MDHFRQLHRIIFEPDFLRSAPTHPVRRVAVHFVLWVATAALVGFASMTLRLAFDGDRVVDTIVSVSGDSHLERGVLHPGRPTPWRPPRVYVKEALRALFPGAAILMDYAPDTLMIIDTTANMDSLGSAWVVMAKTDVLVGGLMASYAELFGEDYVGPLDAKAVHASVREHRGMYLAIAAAWSLIAVGYKVVVGLPFLFIAAYILTIGGLPVPVGVALKRAVYAFTVVLAGHCVEAVAGVHLLEPWYLFMGVAVFVLIRAGWRRPARKLDSEERPGTEQ